MAQSEDVAPEVTDYRSGPTIPLATMTLPSGSLDLRRATLEDLPALVALLAALGSTREAVAGSQDLEPYQRAFRAINTDPAQLLVAAAHRDEIVGTLQLSFIPGLARCGALRAQIEAVRVHETYRSKGLGGAMFEWAIAEARRRGCALVQLTTDKTRRMLTASTHASASRPRTKA